MNQANDILYGNLGPTHLLKGQKLHPIARKVCYRALGISKGIFIGREQLDGYVGGENWLMGTRFLPEEWKENIQERERDPGEEYWQAHISQYETLRGTQQVQFTNPKQDDFFQLDCQKLFGSRILMIPSLEQLTAIETVPRDSRHWHMRQTLPKPQFLYYLDNELIAALN